MKREDGSWDVSEDSVLDFAIDCAEKGTRYALVALVGIDGSSPRFLGAQRVVSEAGSFVGYLSVGCLERAIVSEALGALLENQNRVVRHGQGSLHFDIQVPCSSGIVELALSNRRAKASQCGLTVALDFRPRKGRGKASFMNSFPQAIAGPKRAIKPLGTTSEPCHV